MKTFSSDDILNRLKSALAASTDKELADLLGIKKATLSNWRTRNSIDFPLVFSFCEHINIDWLITGRGEQALTTPTITQTSTENSGENKLLDKIVEQAEEIGRLKERIAQFEREKNNVSVSLQTAPEVLSPSTVD